MFKNIRHIHFVGIGGSGMSGIAEVLINLGYKVTGSDISKNQEAKRLEEKGARVFTGHASQNIAGADVVVTSTAISPTNPEVKAAKAAGIPVIPRIEMLAEIARLKYTIAIAGTHGKTSTSSLVAQILTHNGLEPTVIVGGRLKNLGTGGVLGKGDYLVAEADESDGSFLKLTPTISVITNIDNDHLDYHKTLKKLEEAFTTFANRIPFYGITFVCGDDPGIKKVLPHFQRRFSTYGFGKSCDYRADNIESGSFGVRFQMRHKKTILGNVFLPFSGKHNVLNAMAAAAVGMTVGLRFDQVAEALKEFVGVGRRLEFKGESAGVTVIDDYGHHPTEMKATIAALKDQWPEKRLVVLFQPHRYSRTKLLHKEFGKVLGMGDKVFLFPIYPAGEKPMKGVSSTLISKNIPRKNWTLWEGQTSFADLKKELKTGDVLLTLGAGDVWKWGEKYLESSNTLEGKILKKIPSLRGRVKPNEPLSRHCTWAIGGPAELYIEVHTLEELQNLYQFCLAESVPFFILGWGSNVLFPDKGLKGCVVRLRGNFEKIDFDESKVKVGAGVHLPKLSRRCAEKNLSGVESLTGVPGTVGGALMTNAGTRNGVIGDVLLSVQVMNADGTLSTLNRDQVKLGYRQSDLEGKYVVSAELELIQSQNGDVKEKIRQELDYREKTQPLGTKNVGSVFRNPSNDHAARMIEFVGLKGKQIGKVRFSPKHANFIENLGGATAQDALGLIKLAQKSVKEKFNVDLHPEVKIIAQSSIPK